MLQNMLGKLYLQSIINNRNKASLIEEAKICGVKNYIVQENQKTSCVLNCGIRTCSSQTIVEKPQKVQKSKIDTCKETKIVQLVDSDDTLKNSTDVKSVDDEYMKYCGMYEPSGDENVKVKGSKINTPVQSIKKDKAKKVPKFKNSTYAESIYDECMRWCETNKACAEKNIKEEEPKIIKFVDSEYKCDKIDTPVQCINDQQRNTVENEKHEELCTLCNKPCGENKCSKKHMYCKNQMKYTDEHIKKCVYDSYFDAHIPISELKKNKLCYSRPK